MPLKNKHLSQEMWLSLVTEVFTVHLFPIVQFVLIVTLAYYSFLEAPGPVASQHNLESYHYYGFFKKKFIVCMIDNKNCRLSQSIPLHIKAIMLFPPAL